MHALQIQRLQEIEIEIGEVVDAIEPGRVVRLAKAGMLRGIDRETLRQFLEKPHPAGMPAGAVQEHQRLRIGCRRAAAQHPDRRTIDRDHFRAVRHILTPCRPGEDDLAHRATVGSTSCVLRDACSAGSSG